MLYVTTRGGSEIVTAHWAMTHDPDAGQLIPRQEIRFDGDIAKRSFNQNIAYALELLFQEKISAWDVDMALGKHPVDLMDLNSRSMILPGKSGISVLGTLRGNELTSPNGLVAKELRSSRSRTVSFTDLDRHGHMNNTKYMDWIDDLLPGAFHREHEKAEFTVCYLAEALEGQTLKLCWDLLSEGVMQVDGYREEGEKLDRVFSARFLY